MGCAHSKRRGPPIDLMAEINADMARCAAEPGIELDPNTVNIRDPELRKTLKKTCYVGYVRGPGTDGVRILVPMGDLVTPLEMYERAEAATTREELEAIHMEEQAFRSWSNAEFGKRWRAMALEAPINPEDSMHANSGAIPTSWIPETGGVMSTNYDIPWTPDGPLTPDLRHRTGEEVGSTRLSQPMAQMAKSCQHPRGGEIQQRGFMVVPWITTDSTHSSPATTDMDTEVEEAMVVGEAMVEEVIVEPVIVKEVMVEEAMVVEATEVGRATVTARQVTSQDIR
ncbi:MAG: hypothetical protein Q9216_006015 [Gyalolechia sp. 2 TL-2023]